MLKFALLLAAVTTAPVSFDTYAVEHEGAFLVLPACPTEDSANCVWDAQAHGNGLGQSFYDLNGVTYPVTFE